MKGTALGTFEALVLLAVRALDGERLWRRASTDIERETRRPVSLGAVHTVLERLEAKGYIESAPSDPTAERGGRRRRMFTATQRGRQALGQMEAVRQRLEKLAKSSHRALQAAAGAGRRRHGHRLYGRRHPARATRGADLRRVRRDSGSTPAHAVIAAPASTTRSRGRFWPAALALAVLLGGTIAAWRLWPRAPILTSRDTIVVTVSQAGSGQKT